jgi:nucleoside-triphosphatase THEP1
MATAGILAPVVYRGATRIGYDMVDLHTGEKAPWLRIGEGTPAIGGFGAIVSGMALARQALDTALRGSTELAIIDEVGEWELAAGGHAWMLDRLAASPGRDVVLVIRDSVTARVAARWGFALRSWRPAELPALEAALGIRNL